MNTGRPVGLPNVGAADQDPAAGSIAADNSRQSASGKELVELLDIDGPDAQALRSLPVDLRIVHKGEALVEQGDPVGGLFFVRSGTFKVFQVDAEGYEQVLRFPIRGELMGYDSVCRERHPLAAASLEESSVLVLCHDEVTAARRNSPAFDAAISGLLSRQLLQLADVAELMAAVAAEVRVARFLCQLSARMRRNGESSSRLFLRMSRRDIASYLGLAFETVSRCFSLLADLGYLRVERKEVEILSLAGLQLAARSTRRPAEPKGSGGAGAPTPSGGHAAPLDLELGLPCSRGAFGAWISNPMVSRGVSGVHPE
jgi:CRP/FNR family transcriptional regulator